MLGAISTPLDALLYDEVDKLPAENMEWSRGRVAHSELRLAIYFSAGYSPGAGIDLRYQAGSQHRWLVDCANRSCSRKKSEAICLEDEFPDCMAQIRGEWRRVCPDCKREQLLVPVVSARNRGDERQFDLGTLDGSQAAKVSHREVQLFRPGQAGRRSDATNHRR